MRTILRTIAIAFALAGTSAAATETPAEFYKGRVVSLVVGYGPGGGYDFYARLLSRFMPRHIPGAPTFVVQNMPGAGSLLSVNYLYNSAPRDGTVIGTFAREMTLMSILGYNQASVKFDARKLTWLGSASSSVDDPTILFVRKDRFSSISQAMGAHGRPIVIGATAGGSGGNEWANLMQQVLGINLKIIAGYKDSAGIFLAVENREVDGRSLDYSALKAGRPQWLSPDSEVRAVLQLGRSTRHADFPDVPTADELVVGERNRAIVDVSNLSNTFARPFAAPPNLSKDKAATLQSAFMAALQDPELLAEAGKLKIEVSPIDGQEVLRRIEKLAATDPDVLDQIRRIRTKESE